MCFNPKPPPCRCTTEHNHAGAFTQVGVGAYGSACATARWIPWWWVSWVGEVNTKRVRLRKGVRVLPRPRAVLERMHVQACVTLAFRKKSPGTTPDALDITAVGGGVVYVWRG